MPKFECHISIAYGVSEGYYGRDIELVRTDYGNKFSSDMYRDISCLIIKQLEKKNLEIEFLSKTTQVNTLVAAVLFVDDNDLAVDGDNSKVRMQKMVDLHDTLYKATGGFSQEEKSKFYSWKWVWQQGRKRMKVVKVVIKINDKLIKQLGPKDEEKTLGVNIDPSLKWDEQFTMLIEKMKLAMWKLESTPVTVSNAYLFYNMYLVTHVYFGCGIVNITLSQKKILIKLSEPVLLRKLKLSQKFLREMLFARKAALGIGLMKPSTMIAVLGL